MTYQNPANTNFTDPTRNLTQLVSPVTSFDAAAAAGVTSAYQVGGAVGGSNYASASTNNEDVALIGAWKSVKTTTDADGSGITNTTVGDTITWSIWVTNPHATLPLNAFQVTDLIPGNVTFVTGAQTITTVAGACGAVAKNTLFTGAGANTALLNAAQVLPAGCTIRIDLPMVVLAPAVSTNLVNQPTISGTGIAAFLSDNVDATTVGLPAAIAGDATRTGSVAQTQTTARDPTTVFVSPKVVDLVPLKSHVGNFTIGGTGVFTLSARNIAAVASSVGSYTITDTLPPGLSFVSATGTGWACVNAGQVVTCTSATVIPPNSTNPNAITLTVNVLSGAPAQVINRATISGGGEVAAQTINNTVVDYVTVLRPASSVFFPDGAQEALPNSTVWYPHTFLSQDTGSVVFNFTNTAAPATPGWLQTLYVDTNCNGTFDPAEATVLTNPTTPFAVIPGTQICLIVREFVPANALVGYKDQVNITTTLTPSVGPVKTFTRRDITTVALPAALKLVKEVRNVTAGTPFGTSNTGKPGDTLQYRITYTNNGPVPLTLQTVNDATPNFTTHLVAACGSLGTGLATCTLAAQPVAGGIGPVRWTYTGTLNPGGTGNVTMNVQIAP